MEPATIFAEFVLGMCAIHLIRQTSEHIASWLAKRRPEQKSSKKVVRSDWYVFFSCSDLYGKDSERKLDNDRKRAGNQRVKRDQRPVIRA